MAKSVPSTVGFLPLRFHSHNLEILLRKHPKSDQWVFPKGSRLPLEPDLPAAVRILTSLTASEPVLYLSGNHWVSDQDEATLFPDFRRKTVTSDGRETRKITKYYIGTVAPLSSPPPTPLPSETAWMTLDDAEEALSGAELTYITDNSVRLRCLSEP